jgi:hypothetical protein
MSTVTLRALRFVHGKPAVEQQGLSQDIMAYTEPMPKDWEKLLITPHPPLNPDTPSRLLMSHGDSLWGVTLFGKLDDTGRAYVAGHYLAFEDQAAQLAQLGNLTALLLSKEFLPAAEDYSTKQELPPHRVMASPPQRDDLVKTILQAVNLLTAEIFFECLRFIIAKEKPLAFVGVPITQIQDICLAFQAVLPRQGRMNLSFTTYSSTDWELYGHGNGRVNLRFLPAGVTDKAYMSSVLVYVAEKRLNMPAPQGAYADNMAKAYQEAQVEGLIAAVTEIESRFAGNYIDLQDLQSLQSLLIATSHTAAESEDSLSIVDLPLTGADISKPMGTFKQHTSDPYKDLSVGGEPAEAEASLIGDHLAAPVVTPSETPPQNLEQSLSPTAAKQEQPPSFTPERRSYERVMEQPPAWHKPTNTPEEKPTEPPSASSTTPPYHPNVAPPKPQRSMISPLGTGPSNMEQAPIGQIGDQTTTPLTAQTEANNSDQSGVLALTGIKTTQDEQAGLPMISPDNLNDRPFLEAGSRSDKHRNLWFQALNHETLLKRYRDIILYRENIHEFYGYYAHENLKAILEKLDDRSVLERLERVFNPKAYHLDQGQRDDKSFERLRHYLEGIFEAIKKRLDKTQAEE